MNLWNRLALARSLALGALVASASACSSSRSNSHDDGGGGGADLAGADFAQSGLSDLAMPGGPHDLAGADFALQGDLAHPPIDFGVPAANATCASATTVTNGTTLTAQDSTGGRDDLGAACRAGAHGGVLYYSITLPAYAQVTAVATPTGASPPDLVMRALSACGATSCLGWVDNGIEGEVETLKYQNPSSSSATFLIAVGSYDQFAPGTFNLAITVTQLPPPPMNLLCTMPMTVTDGTMLTGQDASLATQTETNACNAGADGAVLYYKATIPVGQRLRVVATPEGSWDLVLRFLDMCSATSCLDSADVGVSGDAETLTWDNFGASTVDVIIAVGSYSSSNTGTFSLDVHVTTPPPPPANATCATATVVSDGTMLTGEDASRGTQTLTSACRSADGKVLFYKATVPQNNILKVVATPQTSWDLVVRFLNACGASSCLADVDSAGSGSPETLTWKNNGASPVDVIIGIGSYSTTSTGLFNLAVNVTPGSPPPTNTTCATARPIANGTSLVGEDATAASVNLTTACRSFANGNVLFYSASVPTGQTLTVVATPETSWDVVVRFLNACGATSCLADIDNGGSGSAETLSWKNTGGTTANVIIGVGSYSASTTGLFDLTASIAPPPPNASCSTPKMVMNGTSLTGENQTLATVSLSSACVSGGTGGNLFYNLTLPASKTVTAVVTPTGSWDPVIRLIDSCAPVSCRASADVNASGGNETLTYTNSTGGSLNLLLAVGSYSSTTTGTFNMTVSIP
jgi:hypothetical protein